MFLMEHLELNAVIGHAGSVIDGIILLPDNRSMIFALGSTVVKRDIVDPKNQQFLQGHSDRVTCIAIARTIRNNRPQSWWKQVPARSLGPASLSVSARYAKCFASLCWSGAIDRPVTRIQNVSPEDEARRISARPTMNNHHHH